MHAVHKYPVWAGPVYTSHIKYHMIDIMEKVSSQKETVNNEYVAQHVRALPKARLWPKIQAKLEEQNAIHMDS